MSKVLTYITSEYIYTALQFGRGKGISPTRFPAVPSLSDFILEVACEWPILVILYSYNNKVMSFSTCLCLFDLAGLPIQELNIAKAGCHADERVYW